jgi:hypothetical protein
MMNESDRMRLKQVRIVAQRLKAANVDDADIARTCGIRKSNLAKLLNDRLPLDDNLLAPSTQAPDVLLSR